jgi:hypothetical protein
LGSKQKLDRKGRGLREEGKMFNLFEITSNKRIQMQI